jgi:hypothetical protein
MTARAKAGVDQHQTYIYRRAKMDLIAEKIVGKELRQVQHSAGYDTVLIFEDGAITAWTEVKIYLTFGDEPVVVRDLSWSSEMLRIIFAEGDICISRVSNSRNPECFIYGAADDPSIMIVDRGEE